MAIRLRVFTFLSAIADNCLAIIIYAENTSHIRKTNNTDLILFKFVEKSLKKVSFKVVTNLH